LGVGLAWVRIRAESVWPGVIAHAAYNGVALAVLFATLE
jgi:membrane protease YdiL (CAAX protease family)